MTGVTWGSVSAFQEPEAASLSVTGIQIITGIEPEPSWGFKSASAARPLQVTTPCATFFKQ